MTTPVDAISTPLLIAGEERPGGAGTFPVYDPAQTGGIIGYAAAASRDDALAAVAAAEAASPAWAAMTATERVGIVLKALGTLETDKDARTDVLSRENGKIRFEAFIDLAVFSGRFHQGAATRRRDIGAFNTTITKLSRGVSRSSTLTGRSRSSRVPARRADVRNREEAPPTTPLSSVQTLGTVGVPPGLNVVTARTRWSARGDRDQARVHGVGGEGSCERERTK